MLGRIYSLIPKKTLTKCKGDAVLHQLFVSRIFTPNLFYRQLEMDDMQDMYIYY